MKRELSFLLVFLFVAGDLIFLNLAIVASYSFLQIPYLDAEFSNSLYLFIFSNLAWFFLVLIANPYGVSPSIQLGIILKGLFSFVVVHSIVIVSLILFFDRVYTFQQIILLYGILVPLVFLWRFLFFYFVHTVNKRAFPDIHFIIIGQGELAPELRKIFEENPEYGYKFMGYFNLGDFSFEKSDSFDRIKKFSFENGIAEIFWNLPESENGALKKLIDFGLNHFIRIKVVKDYSNFYQQGIQLMPQRQVSIRNEVVIPLDDLKNQLLKRAFDLAFTLVVFVLVLSWLFPLVALLIKLDSKGSILYRQLRAGKDNKPFYCLKFRTMTQNDSDVFVQATRNDPRITKLGKFLRKMSLDEFPQFINVFRGEMSIVGPRPHPIKLNDDFSPRIRKLMSRHYVKPGVTGLAQCMGYRGETKTLSEMKNRITLDRFYVENWSLRFDIRIILKTVASLLYGTDKAY